MSRHRSQRRISIVILSGRRLVDGEERQVIALIREEIIILDVASEGSDIMVTVIAEIVP